MVAAMAMAVAVSVAVAAVRAVLGSRGLGFSF